MKKRAAIAAALLFAVVPMLASPAGAATPSWTVQSFSCDSGHHAKFERTFLPGSSAWEGSYINNCTTKWLVYSWYGRYSGYGYTGFGWWHHSVAPGGHGQFGGGPGPQGQDIRFTVTLAKQPACPTLPDWTTVTAEDASGHAIGVGTYCPQGPTAPSTPQWEHSSGFTCIGGSKSASWVEATQDNKERAWFDNACTRQWLTFTYCQVPTAGQTTGTCHQLNVPPKTHGHLTNLDASMGIEPGGLSGAPACGGDSPSNYGPHNDGYVQRWTSRGLKPEPACKTAQWVDPS